MSDVEPGASEGAEPDDDPSVDVRYPSHPVIDRALALIECGDYQGARATLAGLDSRAPEEIQRAAADIRARITTDRFALIVFGGSLLLVIVVAILAFTR